MPLRAGKDDIIVRLPDEGIPEGDGCAYIVHLSSHPRFETVTDVACRFPDGRRAVAMWEIKSLPQELNSKLGAGVWIACSCGVFLLTR